MSANLYSLAERSPRCFAPRDHKKADKATTPRTTSRDLIAGSRPCVIASEQGERRHHFLAAEKLLSVCQRSQCQ